MTGVLILAVLILGTGVELVAAQIPSVCANNANLTNGTCCPDNCGGIMKGECVNVSKICNTNYTSVPLPPNDERFNWPSKIFTRVCRCNGNYDGFNCSECKFGYGGQDCNTKQAVRVRTSITDPNFNWTKYRGQLSKAKTVMQTRYKVYTGNGSDFKNESSYKEVSLYNLFAWMHHYVAWSLEENYTMHQTAGDYAHESVGFLTWHRIYLLWFEREMQILLEDDSFTVRYWDWTVPGNQLDALFVPNKLGESAADGNVTGDLMSTWHIVCASSDGKPINSSVCDPTRTPGQRNVYRCGTAGNCSYQAGWPDKQNVRRSLSDFPNFRTTANPKYNKYDTMSFSNYMEGFANDDTEDECKNMDSMNYILYKNERDLLCGTNPKIRRRLHNMVHILLGGTMGSIPLAANDPVFINHHTMIDCLFEQWLMNHTNRTNMYPASLDAQFAGHAANDCMVPFIPLYTHGEVFLKSADDYGYRCDLPLFVPPTGTGSPSNPPATNPPATNPPATNPPATNPPATNPPATNPPGQPGNPGNQPGNPGNGADSSLASATMLISMIVVCLVAIVV